MFSAIFLLAVAFVESKSLAVQVALDRYGYSCNAIDGQWGAKSSRALACYCAANGIETPTSPESAFDNLFCNERFLFKYYTVTSEDLSGLVRIPDSAADKAALAVMGYETLKEALAERGHVTVRALERLNPTVDFAMANVGTRVLMPNFRTMNDDLAANPNRECEGTNAMAAELRVSLSRFEIAAFDINGQQIALFPCSIAKEKSKRPEVGELKIVTMIPRPNYTYTPDRVPRGGKVLRHILPPGPNNPVGVAWIGLSLNGYGMHGTPTPERIGRAESHGCFRLANWNAARLYAICRPSTRVVIVE